VLRGSGRANLGSPVPRCGARPASLEYPHPGLPWRDQALCRLVSASDVAVRRSKETFPTTEVRAQGQGLSFLPFSHRATYRSNLPFQRGPWCLCTSVPVQFLLVMTFPRFGRPPCCRSRDGGPNQPLTRSRDDASPPCRRPLPVTPVLCEVDTGGLEFPASFLSFPSGWGSNTPSLPVYRNPRASGTPGYYVPATTWNLTHLGPARGRFKILIRLEAADAFPFGYVSRLRRSHRVVLGAARQHLDCRRRHFLSQCRDDRACPLLPGGQFPVLALEGRVGRFGAAAWSTRWLPRTARMPLEHLLAVAPASFSNRPRSRPRR